MNPNSNQINIEAKLILKPNPASEFVEVILINGGKDNYLLRLIDLEGRNIFYTKKVAGDLKTFVNTSELSSGLYFVLVDDSNGLQVSQKLIIVR